MSIERIAALLERCGGPDKNFPSTDLYNEGWMLRLVLDWFSQNPGIDHDLAFSAGDRWFSEALLPSAFLARRRGDPLAESWTHADGVIGNFMIGANRDGDLTLTRDASRIFVIEAKMFSKLSAGVKNASYFNQAARYAACIAELLSRANRKPTDLKRLGLYVQAPTETIGYGWFKRPLDKADIRQKVERRVQVYEGKKDQWFEDWFLPVLDHMDIGCLSWESILEYIGSSDIASTSDLQVFYRKCLAFNRPANQTVRQ